MGKYRRESYTVLKVLSIAFALTMCTSLWANFRLFLKTQEEQECEHSVGDWLDNGEAEFQNSPRPREPDTGEPMEVTSAGAVHL